MKKFLSVIVLTLLLSSTVAEIANAGQGEVRPGPSATVTTNQVDVRP